ncbi:MAG TPA: hypothetical protein VGM70_08915 [Pseudolysinimonas sp.]
MRKNVVTDQQWAHLAELVDQYGRACFQQGYSHGLVEAGMVPPFHELAAEARGRATQNFMAYLTELRRT